ncbi:MAG: lysylphosphatidylglycerol synthase transmembrane domain-containing protein [Desulfococcaceae bacterium]
MKKKLISVKLQRIISLILVVILVGIVIHEGHSLLDAVKKTKPGWAGAGLICYYVNYFLRAMRFRFVSDGQIQLWPNAIHSACVHGIATYIFPFRSGELTLPVILKSVSGIPLLEGGRILLKARVLDIFTLGLFMLIASIVSTAPISDTLRISWGGIGLILCIMPGFLNMLWKIGKYASSRISPYAETFGNMKLRIGELILTMGIWTAIALCLFFAARSVGVPIGIDGIWFLISIQLPMQLIPLQGIANAGNHEAGWVAGLAILGIPASESLTFAITSHALLLLYVLALGLPAWISRKKTVFEKNTQHH